MSLSDESASALRRCIAILAPHYPPANRAQMAHGIEQFIKRGEWPRWNLADLPRLFYPQETAAASRLRDAMTKACSEGELPCSGRNTPNPVFTPAQLCAWPDCPPVPEDSPLRYWLPAQSRSNTAPSETPEQRRSRRRALLREEVSRSGKRGALSRAAQREGITRQSFCGLFGDGATVESILAEDDE